MKQRPAPLVASLHTTTAALAAALTVFTTAPAEAQFTPVWFDGFNVSANTSDINFELGAPRQGVNPAAGIPASISYLANAGADTWKHQMFGGPIQPLQLAQAGSPGPILASPNFNFKGVTGYGEVIGKDISVALDVGVIPGGAPGSYTQGGITVGANSTLSAAGTSGFAVRLVEDNFSGLGNFLQIYDGASLVGNVIPHSAGAGWANLDLRIDDPADGNPWDGAGSTVIDVRVNGDLVVSYTKGGGGYTDNFVTLEGSANFNGLGLATHQFDNLTVFSSSVPEPATSTMSLLFAGGLLGLAALRRQRKQAKASGCK